jgi:hypothetical protein
MLNNGGGLSTFLKQNTFQKLVAMQLAKICLALSKNVKVNLCWSQEHTTGACTELVNSTHTISLRSGMVLFSSLYIGLPSGPFTFQTYMYAFSNLFHVSCKANPLLFVIYIEKYKLSSPLFNFLLPQEVVNCNSPIFL